LAADVVGYSRLMREDETETLQQLKNLRSELIDPKNAEYGGRIFKTMGDGTLFEFSSAVDAVQCAMDLQQAIARRNVDISEDRRLQLRCGINIGDVIVEGDDIYGDGVNVAARLEALAKPGGVCVSGTVYEHVRHKIEAGFNDLGAQQVKNIADPVHVFAIEMELSPNSLRSIERAGSVLRKPAVAVLPLENISGDPEQEYFADGLTEDITTALALWRSFPVIARNSAQTYKGQSSDIRKVGQELGARYVIEGSVRKAGERVRVTAQLIDAESGRHVWAEKFDRRMEDIFDLQDELTHRIAATVIPELEREEQKRLVMTPPRNLDAWEFYLRGMSALCEPTKDGTASAREMFAKALELDPNYARACVGIAASHSFDLVLEQTESREAAVEGLVAAAQQAAMLDRLDSMTQLILSVAYAWTNQNELSIAAAEKSIEMNPSNAMAHGHLGTMLDLEGRHVEGIASLEHCVRLSPTEPVGAHVHMTFLARAHLVAGHYQDAIAWGQKALAHRTPYAPANYIIGIGLAYLGRQAEALQALQQCERDQPGFVEKRTEWRPYRDELKNELFLEGLRKAGWER
jgi:adenylate cyclase